MGHLEKKKCMWACKQLFTFLFQYIFKMLYYTGDTTEILFIAAFNLKKYGKAWWRIDESAVVGPSLIL